MSDMSKIHAMIKELTPKIIEWRRDFHKYAESGWTEFRTASLLARKMLDLGFKVTAGKAAFSDPDRMGLPPEGALDVHAQRAIAQGGDAELIESMRGGYTGLWADMVCGTGKGPAVALRFDIDAVDCAESMESCHEPASKGYASINQGAMHACGHDGHAAMGLAVAEVVAKYKDALNGTVRLIFQPAEEGVRGALPMVKAGAVKDIDVVLGIHIGMTADTIGTFIGGCYGFAATTKMDVEFFGVGSTSGSAPEKGKNALLAANAAATNLHCIPRHSEGNTRVSVGVLNAGLGRNVVPPYAKLMMETRGDTIAINTFMENEAKRIIKGAALMWDCTYSIKHMGSAASASSDSEIAALLVQAAQEMGVFDNLVQERIAAFSEDYCYMMDEVQKAGGKATYCIIGTPLKAGHHNTRFDFDEECLPRGAEILCRAIWKLLGAE